MQTIVSVQNPHWLPSSLRVKSKIITTAFLHDFTIEYLCPDSLWSCQSMYSPVYAWNMPRPPLPFAFVLDVLVPEKPFHSVYLQGSGIHSMKVFIQILP